MPQIDPATFTEVFTATSRATPKQIEWALRGGLKLLREYVGAAAVADYLSETPANAERSDDLEMGHAHLAYCVLALNAGSRVREGGIIKVETPVEDDARNEYLPPKDVESFVAQHTAKALQFIGAYLITTADESSGDAYSVFTSPVKTGCTLC